MNNISIGGRVQRLRKQFGLSQDKLGKLIGMSRGNISKIEKNLLKPSNAFLTALKERFAINPEWIISGKGEMFIAPEEYIAHGIGVLGIEKFSEGLVRILTDKRFTEIQLSVKLDALIEDDLSEELKELMHQMFLLWHQGDERTRRTLVQLVKAMVVEDK